MERRQPAAPPLAVEGRRSAVEVVSSSSHRPPRRRRSALLGGGLLVAASPLAVGAGLFVPGFAALGVGALLLLLPPSERRERPHTIRRVVHDTAVRIGRGAAELTVRVVRVGGRFLRAVERVVAESGRDAAVRIGSAASAYAAAVGREAAGATSRGWAAAQVGVPRAGRALAAAWRSLARLAHVGSTRAWARSEPALRRLWAACLAGSRRASDETGVLAHSASKRLSAFIDSRTGRRQG